MEKIEHHLLMQQLRVTYGRESQISHTLDAFQSARIICLD